MRSELIDSADREEGMMNCRNVYLDGLHGTPVVLIGVPQSLAKTTVTVPVAVILLLQHH